jgi:hypothetical protein
MGHHELLINSLKTAFVWERRHSSVGSERLICNSRKSFAPVFSVLRSVADARGSAISALRRATQNCAVLQQKFLGP